MAFQPIFTGTTPGDKTGDPPRTQWTKANANFLELFNGLINNSGGKYFPEAYGAVGDGTSRQLSSVASYQGTNTAGWGVQQWNAPFPHVTALTQEIDWAATQKAIATASMAGGGTVNLSNKSYLMASAGATTNDTLVFPECYGSTGVMVNMIGQGDRDSKLLWNRDLGAGKFAISCGDPAATFANSLGRYGPNGCYEGLFQDFSVIGPSGWPSLGTAGVAMDGMAWGAKRNMRRVTFDRFRAGWNIVGDHAVLESVRSDGSYYGMYFAKGSQYFFGDMVWIKCTAGNAAMAAMAVADKASVSVQFDSLFLGTAPYGIYLEGAATAGNQAFLGSTFKRCMIEYCGNACIYDADPTKQRSLQDTNFDDTNFSMNSAYKIPSVNADYMFVFGWLDNFEINNPVNAFGLVPQTVGLIKAFNFSGFKFTGSVQMVFDACADAGKPFLTVTDFYNRGGVWNDAREGYSGTFAFVNGGGGIARHDMVERRTDAHYQGGANDYKPVGVAYLPGAANSYIPVTTRGDRVKVKYSGTIDNSKPLKKAASGAVASCTNISDTPGAQVGGVYGAIDGNYLYASIRL